MNHLVIGMWAVSSEEASWRVSVFRSSRNQMFDDGSISPGWQAALVTRSPGTRPWRSFTSTEWRQRYETTSVTKPPGAANIPLDFTPLTVQVQMGNLGRSTEVLPPADHPYKKKIHQRVFKLVCAIVFDSLLVPQMEGSDCWRLWLSSPRETPGTLLFLKTSLEVGPIQTNPTPIQSRPTPMQSNPSQSNAIQPQTNPNQIQSNPIHFIHITHFNKLKGS